MTNAPDLITEIALQHADPRALERFAELLTAIADLLDAQSARLRWSIATLPWKSPAADRCISAIGNCAQRLSANVEDLHSAAISVRRHSSAVRARLLENGIHR